MSEELTKVDPSIQANYVQRDIPLIYGLTIKYLPHDACPVPNGIIKATEVKAKVALPVEVISELPRPSGRGILAFSFKISNEKNL